MGKKYACCYCGQRFDRKHLGDHLEKEHEDELPPHYTGYHQAYDIINHKNGHGTCIICGKNTPWDEKRLKYRRLCGDPKCAKKIRDTYRDNMMRVHGKVHLLDDPVHQEKMLSHRHISGTYIWSDGTKKTYTGSFEKSLMEFLDKTLEYKSDEVLAPGPILEYKIKGKTRHWITDFLILPYNLIIEVKDGGNNPNKRNMPEYRAKQYAKEKMITNMGVYNYLRLTNNDFSQLFTMLAELKLKTIEEEDSPIYRIHEDFNIFFEEFGEDADLLTLITNGNNIIDTYKNNIIAHPLTKMANIEFTESLTENDKGDPILEFINIKPSFVNSTTINTCHKLLESFVTDLNQSLNTDIVESYLLDEDDISKGFGIGILL